MPICSPDNGWGWSNAGLEGPPPTPARCSTRAQMPRLAGSANFLYRQFGSPEATSDFMEIFARLERLERRRAPAESHHHHS